MKNKVDQQVFSFKKNNLFSQLVTEPEKITALSFDELNALVDLISKESHDNQLNDAAYRLISFTFYRNFQLGKWQQNKRECILKFTNEFHDDFMRVANKSIYFIFLYEDCLKNYNQQFINHFNDSDLPEIKNKIALANSLCTMSEQYPLELIFDDKYQIGEHKINGVEDIDTIKSINGKSINGNESKDITFLMTKDRFYSPMLTENDKLLDVLKEDYLLFKKYNITYKQIARLLCCITNQFYFQFDGPKFNNDKKLYCILGGMSYFLCFDPTSTSGVRRSGSVKSPFDDEDMMSKDAYISNLKTDDLSETNEADDEYLGFDAIIQKRIERGFLVGFASCISTMIEKYGFCERGDYHFKIEKLVSFLELDRKYQPLSQYMPHSNTNSSAINSHSEEDEPLFSTKSITNEVNSIPTLTTLQEKHLISPLETNHDNVTEPLELKNSNNSVINSHSESNKPPFVTESIANKINSTPTSTTLQEKNLISPLETNHDDVTKPLELKNSNISAVNNHSKDDKPLFFTKAIANKINSIPESSTSQEKAAVKISLDNLPSDILHHILKYLPSQVKALINFSALNKSFNVKMKEAIFEVLKNVDIRYKFSYEISNINRIDYKNFKPIDNKKIKSLFESKTNIPVQAISVHSDADGKKMYCITTIDYHDKIKYQKSAEKLALLFTKKQQAHLYNESLSTSFGMILERHMKCYINEHDLTILNDSSIVKDRPTTKAYGIKTAIGETTACLLSEKTNNIPFIEFDDKDKNRIKIVLRFTDNNYARELFYALQKERYIFGDNPNRFNESNKFNQYDIYPCEYSDNKTAKTYQFITTSSIQIIGLDNLFRFIFNTCKLSEKYVAGFICKYEKNNNPILKLSDTQIIDGFRNALKNYIEIKLNEFLHLKNDKTFLNLLNHSTIDKTFNFLDKIKQELQNNFSSYEELHHLFITNDTKGIDKDLLKSYQHFNIVFSEIYSLRRAELNQNGLKNT